MQLRRRHLSRNLILWRLLSTLPTRQISPMTRHSCAVVSFLLSYCAYVDMRWFFRMVRSTEKCKQGGSESVSLLLGTWRRNPREIFWFAQCQKRWPPGNPNCAYAFEICFRLIFLPCFFNKKSTLSYVSFCCSLLCKFLKKICKSGT